MPKKGPGIPGRIKQHGLRRLVRNFPLPGRIAGDDGKANLRGFGRTNCAIDGVRWMACASLKSSPLCCVDRAIYGASTSFTVPM